MKDVNLVSSNLEPKNEQHLSSMEIETELEHYNHDYSKGYGGSLSYDGYGARSGLIGYGIGGCYGGYGDGWWRIGLRGELFQIRPLLMEKLNIVH